MSENGERKIASFLDAQRKRDKREPVQMDPDLIDFSKIAPLSEIDRQSEIDATALNIIRTMRNDPRLRSAEQLADAYVRDEKDPIAIIEGTSHSDWIQDPGRFYVAAERYLHAVDATAESIVNSSLNPYFPRLGKDAKSKDLKESKTEFLVSVLRDPRHNGLSGYFLQDLAFLYRHRRANGEL